MIKLRDFKTGSTNAVKEKYVRNTGFLNVTNNSSETLIFTKDEANRYSRP